MIDAVDLKKSFGGQVVLNGATFKISPGERLALVGPNGSGKTTILRILVGEEAIDGGEVQRRRNLEIGYLPQEIAVTSSRSLLGYVEDVAEDLRRAEGEIREIEAKMTVGAADSKLLDRYGFMQNLFESLGGYAFRSRAERILFGLGFRREDLGRPLSALSGGWRMRASLARILVRQPDLVLLDEPTNHLDIVSLEWLEGHLLESSSAYLIVSHDVSFLERVVTGVLALEDGRILRTQGGYSQYEADRRLREEQALAAYEGYQRRRSSVQAFADRFRYKATKARQVQSRLRRSEKEELPPPPPPRTAAPDFRFPQPERSGRAVVQVESVDVGYGGDPVYKDLCFRVERGDKVALIGPNGAGKSTLLKVMAGVLPPIAGQVRFGHGVTVSYFAQHQTEQLDASRTVLGEMMALPGLRTELEMRSLLGAFLFSGEAVEKRVSVLSGGEKSRLVLAKILADPGNFLLLDEPTNHLDIAGCEVLKRALAGFSGAMCLITHDRDLINRVATRVAYVERGQLQEYLGNYDDFARKRAAEIEDVGGGARPRENPERSNLRLGRKDLRRQEAERRARLRKETAPLREAVERLEAEIVAAEERIAALEASLSDPRVYSDPERAAASARERADLSRRLGELNAAWEVRAMELEGRERAAEVETGYGSPDWEFSESRRSGGASSPASSGGD